MFHRLIAFTTLKAYAAKTKGTALQATQAGEISQCLQSLPKQFPEPRVKNICTEIGALL